jgi:D-hydroxyproline dehydrogenase subunit alpha
VVADERARGGGQYFKQRDVAGMAHADAQQREGARRIEAAVLAGVRFLHKTTVWGAFPGPELVADTPDGTRRIRPRALVLATGAIERGWPVEGWTLPGVMTTGAAQTMWRTARRAPPGRVLVAGNGPLNLQLAAELLRGGATVAGVVEAAARPTARALGDLARMAASAPGLVAQGAAYRLALMRAGVPLIEGAQLVSVHRHRGALLALLDNGGEVAADTICLGYGLSPADELARALGCDGAVDGDMRTPMAGVYRVGDGVALGGAHVAAAQGRIAGAAIARQFGHSPSDGAARRTLARHRRFQDALWRVYAPARLLSPRMTGATILCRCEGVRRDDVDRARAAGAGSMAAVKLATRAGMGACQGRYCTPVLAELCGATDDPGIAPRVPVRPVTIGDLAR